VGLGLSAIYEFRARRRLYDQIFVIPALVSCVLRHRMPRSWRVLERLHALLLLGHRRWLDQWHRVLAWLQVRDRVRPVTGVGCDGLHVRDRRRAGALWRHPWLRLMHAGRRMMHAGLWMVHAGRRSVHAGRLRHGLLLRYSHGVHLLLLLLHLPRRELHRRRAHVGRHAHVRGCIHARCKVRPRAS